VRSVQFHRSVLLRTVIRPGNNGSPPLIEGYIGELAKGPQGFGTEDFIACTNAEDVLYQAVVFDAWVLNPDRHHNNVLIKSSTQDSRAYLIDHDLAIFHARRSASEVEALADDFIDGWDPNLSAWLREDPAGTWRGGIEELGKMRAMSALVRAVRDSDISSILEHVPEPWRTRDRCVATERFLRGRRDNIDAIIDSRLDHFPSLAEREPG
jgi:hypothetical protein